MPFDSKENLFSKTFFQNISFSHLTFQPSLRICLLLSCQKAKTTEQTITNCRRRHRCCRVCYNQQHFSIAFVVVAVFVFVVVVFYQTPLFMPITRYIRITNKINLILLRNSSNEKHKFC